MICLDLLTTVHYCNCMTWYHVISAWLVLATRDWSLARTTFLKQIPHDFLFSRREPKYFTFHMNYCSSGFTFNHDLGRKARGPPDTSPRGEGKRSISKLQSVSRWVRHNLLIYQAFLFMHVKLFFWPMLRGLSNVTPAFTSSNKYIYI